jgi:hypothetical protein
VGMQDVREMVQNQEGDDDAQEGESQCDVQKLPLW